MFPASASLSPCSRRPSAFSPGFAGAALSVLGLVGLHRDQILIKDNVTGVVGIQAFADFNKHFGAAGKQFFYCKDADIDGVFATGFLVNGLDNALHAGLNSVR